MVFRYDPDLSFLKHCDDAELKNLADLLIYDTKGGKRLTCSLTEKSTFKKAQETGNYRPAWEAIAEEYQLFGGDTFVNIIRGQKGVTYREILCDLCSLLHLEYSKNAKTTAIEKQFMLGVLKQSLQGMTPEERKALVQHPDMMLDMSDFSVPAMMGAFMVLFRTGGVMARRLMLSLINIMMKALLGRTLTLAASETLVRSVILFSGPVGWTLNIALFLPFLTGPNKKVTLVATLYIATLRRARIIEKIKKKKKELSSSAVKDRDALLKIEKDKHQEMLTKYARAVKSPTPLHLADEAETNDDESEALRRAIVEERRFRLQKKADCQKNHLSEKKRTVDVKRPSLKQREKLKEQKTQRQMRADDVQ